ncbi:hypothetical protein ACN47E_007097 [Coniothyrium glycines]
MKVLQFATLFGGAAAAVHSLPAHNVERALSDTATSVTLVTSTYMVTEICLDAPYCPPGSTVVQTSTTVARMTTTVCAVTMSPGYQPSAIGVPSASVVDSSYLAGTGDASGSILFPSTPGSVPVYGPPKSSASVPSSIALSSASPNNPLPMISTSLPNAVPTSQPWVSDYTPIQTSALPINAPSTPSSGSWIAPTASSGTSAGPVNTRPDSAPISYPVSSAISTGPLAGPSSDHVAHPTSSVALSSSTQISPPSGVTSSTASSYSSLTRSADSAVPSSSYTGPSSVSGSSSIAATGSGSAPASSAAIPSQTATDAIPTSVPISSIAYGPVGTSSAAYDVSSDRPSISSISNPGSASASTSPTGASSSITLPIPSGIASMSSSYGLVSPSFGYNSSAADSTTRITSYVTQTLTSFITSPPPSGSHNNTATATDAVRTSLPSSVSGYPSGSGFPRPPANGTLVSPSPSYIEVPINMGQVVESSKNSLVAMVIAIAFALFA